MTWSDVAIVIPTLNEEDHIGELLASMVRQEPRRVREILVVDGGSTDATREIVRSQRDPRVRLLDNPARLQSAGINLAAAHAVTAVTIIIRIDAHARYPDDFVKQLLDSHDRVGAPSVVTHLRSVGVGPFQRAVAAASNSPFGTGGARHRTGGVSAYVDHGHHALFDRATYLSLGGYDETFVANEDAEYDARLRASGGRIWFADGPTVCYFPRATPQALARQYFRYGRGRARTRAKHGERLHPRQVAPAALVVALGGSLVAGIRVPAALLVPLGYLTGVSAATLLLVAQTRDLAVARAALALPIMHLAWGAGFLLQSSLQLKNGRGQSLFAR